MIASVSVISLSAKGPLQPPLRLDMDRINLPSSGFTAVNSDGPTTASDKPQYSHITAPANVDHPFSWRSDGHSQPENVHAVESTEEPSSPPKKRKRSTSPSRDFTSASRQPHAYGASVDSPRQRGNNLDSAIDVSFPGNSSSNYPLDRRDTYIGCVLIRLIARIFMLIYPSDTASLTRWNCLPPPIPRPEIEAELAESLARELEPVNPVRVKSQPTIVAEALSPASDTYDAQYSPEQAAIPGEDPEDAKKRKRKFSNRTKTGCHTCRTRKKKCDERKPLCQNCERGGFACHGYGPKPSNYKSPPGGSNKGPPLLQSKPTSGYDPSTHGPTTYYQTTQQDSSSVPHQQHSQYSRSYRPQPPDLDTTARYAPPHHPHPRDSWPHSAWSANGNPPETFPPPYPIIERGPLPPIHPHPPPWSTSRPLSTGTSSSQRTAALALRHPASAAHLSEKDKMLRGLPFHYYIDDVLLTDRLQCKGALERYNDAARSTAHVSSEERGRHFRAIVDPSSRPELRGTQLEEPYRGPHGYVGNRTIVESPFRCEYGYNIHLGDDVVISAGAYFQDACDIRIGDRSVVGPGVKFYGMTASVDKEKRKGSQGTFLAGRIEVGCDVLIGGDVVVMPYRKIGEGAVVGAGSVVTKVCSHVFRNCRCGSLGGQYADEDFPGRKAFHRRCGQPGESGTENRGGPECGSPSSRYPGAERPHAGGDAEGG